MENGGMLGMAPGERQELPVVIDAVATVLDDRDRIRRTIAPLVVESVRHEFFADAALRRRGERGMAMDEVFTNGGARRLREIQPWIAQQRQAVRELLGERTGREPAPGGAEEHGARGAELGEDMLDERRREGADEPLGPVAAVPAELELGVHHQGR